MATYCLFDWIDERRINNEGAVVVRWVYNLTDLLVQDGFLSTDLQVYVDLAAVGEFCFRILCAGEKRLGSNLEIPPRHGWVRRSDTSRPSRSPFADDESESEEKTVRRKFSLEESEVVSPRI